MINLTLSFASVSEMQAALHEMLHGHPANTLAPMVYAAPPAPVAPAVVVEQEAPKAPKPTRQAKAAPAESPAATQPVSETVTAATTAPAEPEAASASPSEPVAKAITLEDVRAKLAAISQAGKQPQVKALIAELGATRLTDIPADKYAELIEKADAL